jgi:hypothetical protein
MRRPFAQPPKIAQLPETAKPRLFKAMIVIRLR